MAVDSISDFLQERINERTLLRDFRAGEKTLKEKCAIYIPKRSVEEDEETYQWKVKGAYLYNYVELNIKKLSSKPFIKPPTIKSEENALFFKELEFDFDNNNHTLQDFGRTLLEDALWDSQAHIFVDFPVAEKDVDGSYIQNNEAMPTAIILNNDNILHFRYQGKKLVYLRFKDYVKVPDESGFGDDEVMLIKEFKKIGNKVYWNAYIQNADDDEDYSKVYEEDNLFGLDYIPLVSFYPISARIPFKPDLIFQNMANINKKHFWFTADTLSCQTIITNPFLAISGVDPSGDEDEKGPSMGVSTFNAFFLPENGKMEFVEHTGKAVETSNQTLEKMERQMESMGIDFLLNKSGNESATETVINQANSNSILSSICVNLKEALEKIVDIYCDWLDIDKTFYIDLTTKFDVKLNSDDVNMIEFLYTNNILSAEDTFNECQRRGVIASDLSYKDTQEKKESEFDMNINLEDLNKGTTAINSQDTNEVDEQEDINQLAS